MKKIIWEITNKEWEVGSSIVLEALRRKFEKKRRTKVEKRETSRKNALDVTNRFIVIKCTEKERNLFIDRSNKWVGEYYD